MRHEEIERDLDQAIAKLTDAKAKVPSIAAETDLGAHRKMCGAVQDYQSWLDTKMLPEVPPEAETKAKLAAPSEPHEVASEVVGMNVNDAKDAISRMRSVEKLHHIAGSDHRHTVQDAAKKRLTELEGEI